MKPVVAQRPGWEDPALGHQAVANVEVAPQEGFFDDYTSPWTPVGSHVPEGIAVETLVDGAGI